MTVGSIMNREPATVPLSENFENAFCMLRDRRIESLPVVDSEGIYKGMFDLTDVWELLLPRAILLRMQSLTDLSFVSDAREALQEKLKEAGPNRIVDYLDANVEAVYPETPVKEAIFLLMEHPGNLPVVDRGSRRLLGIVSPWEILEALR